MPLSVRLPAHVEQELANYCAAHDTTKSEVVQKALDAYLRREASPDLTLYERFNAAGLIGTGTNDLLGGKPGTNKNVREAIRRKLLTQRR